MSSHLRTGLGGLRGSLISRMGYVFSPRGVGVLKFLGARLICAVAAGRVLG